MNLITLLWILALGVALWATTLITNPKLATLREVLALIVKTGIVIWSIVAFRAVDLHAQTRTSLSLCPKSSVVIGDKFTTVKSSTGALCIRRDTAVAVVMVPAPAPAGAAVEPTGMTKLAENDMSCYSSCGNGWFFSQDYAGAAMVTVDSGAPRSATRVVQQTYTPALVPGSSPASIGTSISAKQTVYLAVWMKVSDNYIGHGTGVNKVIHFYTAARTTAENVAIFLLRGAGTGPLLPSFGVQNLAAPYQWTDPTGAIHFDYVANLDPNVAQCVVTRGRWTRYEVVLTSNTPGVADGRVELWMDGTKCLSYSGIPFAAFATDSRWNAINWSPTYGGAGGTITTSFFTQVDHIYVSGK